MPAERTSRASGSGAARGGRGRGRGRGGAGGLSMRALQFGGDSSTGGTPRRGPRVKVKPIEELRLWKTPDPDFAAKFDDSNIKSLSFLDDFIMADEHLQAIIDRPQLAGRLQLLRMGDQETGSGRSLHDSVIRSLLTITPNLLLLSLDGCTNVTNDTLISILSHCPKLKWLRITGNDRVRGEINGKGLKELEKADTVGTGLKELVLFDQPVYGDKEAKALTKARKGLVIKLGGSGSPASMYRAGKLVAYKHDYEGFV